MFCICRIIIEEGNSSHELKKYLSGYPVVITNELPDDYILPVLIIGWDFVKRIFPEQKIHNNKIKDNLFWTYSDSESKEVDEDRYLTTIQEFVNKNLFSWLPSDFKLQDSIFGQDFSKFIENNINQDTLTYVHFNGGAIYMRNGENNYIFNVKSLWLINSNYKIILTEMLNNMNCMIYSYDGIEDYVDLDRLGNLLALDIVRWVKFGVETPIKYFQIIPNVDISRFIPFLMSKIPTSSLSLDEDEKLYCDRMSTRDKAVRWMSNRYVSFSDSFDKKLDFLYRENARLAKLKYSSKRTITGRITCTDNYNPQNLSKSNDDRKEIVSRFLGGRIYQFDYTSFEARIALYLSEDLDFIEQYYDKDIHYETAKIILDTFDITEQQREDSKRANMAIMYGSGEENALRLLENYPDPADKLRKIKIFLEPIFKKAKEIIDEVKSKGYVINKWGSIIKPEKDFAGFNNYLQSTAAEIIIDKIIEIKPMLDGHLSQFMFQVHDSLVFDIHPDEFDLVQEIASVLSHNKGMLFSIVYKHGLNYKDLSTGTAYF